MTLSSISKVILANAFSQLEDAEYENYARIYVGDEMVLLDHDDFEELRNDILTLCPDHVDSAKLKEFGQIVKTWED